MLEVLFRVDGGGRLGLGNPQRCLSLATALRHLGADSFFLTNERQVLAEWVSSAGFRSSDRGQPSWGEQDLRDTIDLGRSLGSSVVVVDSREAGGDYLRELRAADFFVCAIDDLALCVFPCQMVVNGGAQASTLPYRSSSGDTRFVLGPEYAILGRPFWEGSSAPTRGETVNEVLVTLGGADPKNLMPEILRILDEAPGSFSVSAVIGPFFDNVRAVEEVATNASRPVTLLRGLTSLHDLMLRADLAVSGAGQTLHELATVGCPAVAVEVASDQGLQLAAFAEAGSVSAVRRCDAEGVAEIRETVSTLLRDAQLRASMATAGRRLVDGRGALRVAEAIMTGVAARATVDGAEACRTGFP